MSVITRNILSGSSFLLKSYIIYSIYIKEKNRKDNILLKVVCIYQDTNEHTCAYLESMNIGWYPQGEYLQKLYLLGEYLPGQFPLKSIYQDSIFQESIQQNSIFQESIQQDSIFQESIYYIYFPSRYFKISTRILFIIYICLKQNYIKQYESLQFANISFLWISQSSLCTNSSS